MPFLHTSILDKLRIYQFHFFSIRRRLYWNKIWKIHVMPKILWTNKNLLFAEAIIDRVWQAMKPFFFIESPFKFKSFQPKKVQKQAIFVLWIAHNFLAIKNFNIARTKNFVVIISFKVFKTIPEHQFEMSEARENPGYDNIRSFEDLSYSDKVAKSNKFCKFYVNSSASFAKLESFVYGVWRFVIFEIICDRFDDTFDSLIFTMLIATSNTMLEKFKVSMIDTVWFIIYDSYGKRFIFEQPFIWDNIRSIGSVTNIKSFTFGI